MEIDQLQKVKDFRAGLKSRGVLYQDFKKTTDFIEMVRNHLESLVSDEWQNGKWSPIPGLDEDSPQQMATTVTPLSQDSHSEDETGATDAFVDFSSDNGDGEDDLGLLDYVASFIEETSAMNLTLERMAEHTTRVGDEMQARTAETESLLSRHKEVKHVGGSREQQDYVANVRGIVDSAAQNLSAFVQAMIPSVEEYRTHSQAMFTNLRNGLQAQSELGNPTDENIPQTLEALISNMASAQDSTASFQASIDSVPALTGKFKRAKRKAAAVLGELTAEISLTADEVQKTLEVVRSSEELNN